MNHLSLCPNHLNHRHHHHQILNRMSHPSSSWTSLISSWSPPYQLRRSLKPSSMFSSSWRLGRSTAKVPTALLCKGRTGLRTCFHYCNPCVRCPRCRTHCTCRSLAQQPMKIATWSESPCWWGHHPLLNPWKTCCWRRHHQSRASLWSTWQILSHSVA